MYYILEPEDRKVMEFSEILKTFKNWRIICTHDIGEVWKLHYFIPLAITDVNGNSQHNAFDEVRKKFPQYSDTLTILTGYAFADRYKYNVMLHMD